MTEHPIARPGSPLARLGRVHLDSIRSQLGFAAVVSVVGVLVTLAADSLPVHPPGLMVLELPVLVSAYAGGLTAGLAATGLSAVLAEVVGIDPHVRFRQPTAPHALEWLLMVGTGVFASYLSESLRRARRAAEHATAIRDAVLANLGEAVVATTPDGRIAFLNAEAGRLCGHSPEEALGRPLDQVCGALMREVMSGALPGSGGGHAEPSARLVLRLDAHDLPVEWRQRTVRDETGRELASVIVVRDLSAEEGARLAREALETQLSDVAATAPGVLYTFRRAADGTTTFPFVSTGFEDLFGVAMHEARASAATAFAAVHPDDVGRLWATGKESARDLSPWRVDFRVRHPAKGEIVLGAHAIPHRDRDGSVVWHGVLTEVTDRVQALRALEVSEARFRSYVEHAPDAVVVLDGDGRFVDFNAAATVLYGCTAERLQRSTMLDFLHPDDRGRAHAMRLREQQDGVVEGELRKITADGRVIWVAVRGVPLGDGRSLAYLRDITASRRASDVLAEQEARFRSYVEHAPEAIVVIDRAGHFLDFNQAALELHNCTAEELAAGTIFDFLPVEERPNAERNRERERERELGLVEAEFQMVPKGRAPVWVALRGTRLDDGTSLAYMRDVTERHRAAEALAESEARFRSYVESAPDAVVVVDREGRFLEFNQAALALHGVTADVLRESKLFDFHPPDERPRILEHRSDELRASTIEREYRLIPRDREEVWVAVRATALGDGKSLAHLRDITEQKRNADALAASETRFRSYMEHAPDAVVVSSQDGRFLDWNAAAARMLGRTDDQIRASRIFDVFAPEEHERVLADVSRLYQGENIEGEYQAVRGDGSRFWVVIRSATLADGTSLSYAHDITARRQIEEAIHESEARLKAIVDSAMDGIVSVDEEQRIVLLNPAAEQMFGTSLTAVKGQPLTVLLPPDERDEHPRQFDAFARSVTGQRRLVSSSQVVGRRSSGETFPIEASISQARVGDRKLFTAIVRDITARVRAQEELRESDERFRQLADNVREVFWLNDATSGAVVFVSRAYETVWGRSCESLYAIPNDWASTIHPEDRDRVLAALPKQALGAYDEEYRIVRPDGTVRWIRDQAFPVRDGEGRLIRIAGVAEDVTARRELETQLRQTQKMESIGLLAAGVAHDFNNLLTVIAGNTELLLADLPAGGEPHALAAEIQVAGERAAALTRQLLAFSRRQVLEPQVLDLNTVVADTEKMLRRLVGEDIVVTTHLANANPRVHLDPGHLVQVIMNLAVNARDAMPRGGRLVIATGAVERSEAYAELHPSVRPGRYVMLSVSDTGAGMTREVRERVFEPFFTTKGAGRGTGLGLAVVHGIVEQSGGHLEVDSDVGAGSTFRLYFPVVVESIAARLDGQTEAGTRGTETVLLVEDEETVRRLGERALRSYGYQVLAAVDGRHAVEVLARARDAIDILVTDVVMPNMDGRELSDHLRARFPTLKVLFTSGYTDDAMIRHGVNHAEVAFLQKPYTPLVLVRKVRDLLDRS